MKKLLFSLLILSTLCARPATMQWTLQDHVAGALTVRKIYQEPIYYVGVFGTNFVTGDRRTITNGTPGVLWNTNTLTIIVTNLYAGALRTIIPGPYKETILTNTVPDTNGFVLATDYTGVATNLPQYSFAYSQAVSDSRYIRTNLIKNYIYPGSNVTFVTNANGTVTVSSTGGGSGSATNVFFIAGQSTTPRTIGGSNAVDVVGTLTNSTTGNAATVTSIAGNAGEVADMVSSGTNGFSGRGLGAMRVFLVDNYGADHNPSGTNDHWAIQAAIDDAKQYGGGEIRFSATNYYIGGRSFHTWFGSEGQPNCITLWSNCAWILSGKGNLIMTGDFDTNSNVGQGNWINIIGSGNDVSNAWTHSWPASKDITIRDITIDVNEKTYLYDAIEIHSSHTILFQNVTFKNSPTGADAIDAGGEFVTADGCYFTNWHGSLWHPNTSAIGTSIMRNSLAQNCNNSPTDNWMTDISSGIPRTTIENCVFTNMMRIANVAGSKTFTLNNCIFYMSDHAGVTPQTNLLISASSALQLNGTQFISTGGTANTIGVVVLEQAARIMAVNSTFNGVRAIHSYNAGYINVASGTFSGSQNSIFLSGTSGAGYNFNNCYFELSGNALYIFDPTGLAHNVTVRDSSFNGGIVKATGTNWTFAHNSLTGVGSCYFSDSTSGYCQFFGNMAYPFNNTDFAIRFNGPNNVISGNKIPKLYPLHSSATSNVIVGNVFDVISYFGGATVSTLTSGAWRSNFKSSGGMWDIAETSMNISNITVFGNLIGNGSGLSNAVDIIAGDGSVTIVTNANKRSFTITAAGGGGGGWTGNPNQFTGGSTTNIKNGVLLTNAVNYIDDETAFLRDANAGELMSYDSDNDDMRVNAGLLWTGQARGDGRNITNLNAAYISGNLSVSNLTAVTLTADTFNGDGNGLSNLNASAISSGTVPIERLIFDSYTNGWSMNTPFVLGRTNAMISSGAATGGITGVANLPTEGARFGELTFIATGTITFTNPASMRANDYLTSRTLTNGNVVEIALKVILGVTTNLSIVQFK